jgi:N-acetylglutamate synthase-like GNAT family acetyltransferase
MTPLVRELARSEFPLVEAIWYHYRGQKTDPAADRIFGAFVDGTLAAVARCKRHPDGIELDGVFTIDEYRGKGLARLVVNMAVKACGHETLYLHSTLDLIGFYRSFGFVTIPEDELPTSIKERLIFCFGEMYGCNAAPMRREPSPG